MNAVDFLGTPSSKTRLRRVYVAMNAFRDLYQSVDDEAVRMQLRSVYHEFLHAVQPLLRETLAEASAIDDTLKRQAQSALSRHSVSLLDPGRVDLAVKWGALPNLGHLSYSEERVPKALGKLLDSWVGTIGSITEESSRTRYPRRSFCQIREDVWYDVFPPAHFEQGE